MNFSKRQGFNQMETDLTAQDFMQMRLINRIELLKFLNEAIKMPMLSGIEMSGKSVEDPE